MPTQVETQVLTGQEAVAEATALPSVRPARYSPAVVKRIAEAATLFGQACRGNRRAALTFQEKMSTSDFPNLMGAVFGRQLMATYQQIPKIWPSFATRATVNDFRAKTFVDLLGGRATLSKVPELTEYPERAASENTYTLIVGKFGARVGWSWEANINDDLQALRDLPDRMAQGAADTEDYTATNQLVIATGPNTAFFKAGNGNTQVTGAGTALTADSLQTALTAISTRLDSENRPINISGYVLMVPPALEVAANNIVNATEIRDVSGNRTSIMRNWLSGMVQVVVNHWIPVIDVSADVNTRWYVLPKPSTNRPAVALGFLRGHETPDLRVKVDTGQSLSGGSLGPDEGSFNIDDIQYRIRHVLGGTTLDPKATYAAKGAA